MTVAVKHMLTDALTLTTGLEVAMPLALGESEEEVVGELVALGGHTARRTLGAPPSAMTMLEVIGSHAMPCGAASVALVPIPSVVPIEPPPMMVETTPVTGCTARISALPASATRMYAPS